MNLKTSYLGIELKNPVIAASSPFTASAEKIVRLAQAGVGAVVLKSVFEEQITGEAAAMRRYDDRPEAADYLRNYAGDDSLKSHLELIETAKRQTDIPVIASINCKAHGAWTEYARKIEQAGADALELNIFFLPTSAAETAEEVEKRYLDIVADVAGALSIPVSVKLGARLTNVLNLCRDLYYRGARGAVMFNRFYEPDINIDSMTLKSADTLSERSELRNSLRWISMTSAEVAMLDIAATTGVHTGEDVVKALLAGARAVQICTALYRDGIGAVAAMNDYLAAWMDAHSCGSIEEFRGHLNSKGVPDHEALERVQYMKFFPR